MSYVLIAPRGSKYVPPVVETSYTTNLPATEDPISEGGKWLNGDTDSGGSHNRMETASGRCFGGALVTGFDDAICVLNHPTYTATANQRITATVYIAGGYTPGGDHELIFVLRGNIHGTNDIEYHEIQFLFNSTLARVIHQPGPEGGYDQIKEFFDLPFLVNGDVISCWIVGHRIRATINDVLYIDYTEINATYQIADGQPGMSHFVASPSTPQSFSFTAPVTIENA